VQTRDRLVLALDVDDMVEALRLAKRLQPYFATAKVGLELFSAAGPDAVASISDLGYDIFLDLKLHDIPTTVRKAARVIGALGTSYLTLHARSGPVMLRAGVEGLAEGAERAGLPHPVALAVTVLTSDGDAPAHILGHRVAAAVEAGCGGLILAAADVRNPRPGPAGHAGRRHRPRRRPAGDRADGHRGARPGGGGGKADRIVGKQRSLSHPAGGALSCAPCRCRPRYRPTSARQRSPRPLPPAASGRS
jgi:orotidine 5'-phosphate decarboxylase subfamily 1